MDARTLALEAHKALLNGSGKFGYFERRGISRQIIQGAYVGFQNGGFTYPCIGKDDELLGIHYKSEGRDDKGKRRQSRTGYAHHPPPKQRPAVPTSPSTPARATPRAGVRARPGTAGSR